MENALALKSQDNNIDYKCSNCGTFVGTPNMHLKECPGCKRKIIWKEKATKD